MAILAITNGFGKLPDAELETRSYRVLQGVTDNPAYFPAVGASMFHLISIK
jgi:hypothetical protein